MQQTYDLKTLNSLTKIKDTVSFEQDLWYLVNKIKFQKVSSNFQNHLKENIKPMKKSKNLFAFVDKTSNIYQIRNGKYNKSTTDATTSMCKKIPDKISNETSSDGKKRIENKEVVN